MNQKKLRVTISKKFYTKVCNIKILGQFRLEKLENIFIIQKYFHEKEYKDKNDKVNIKLILKY